jgi:hypothetical protein
MSATMVRLGAATLVAGMLAVGSETAEGVITTDGLVLHYHASNFDQGTGIWTNTGSAGAAANANPGGNGPPTFIASSPALNNQPAVQFNGVNDLSGSYDASLFAGGAATVFIVANIVENPDPSRGDEYELFWSSGRTDTFTAFGGSGQGYSGLFRDARVEGNPASGMPIGNAGSHLFETLSTTSVYQVILDGEVMATDLPDFLANGQYRIGGNAGGNDFFVGQIAEILVYNRVLSLGEIYAIRTELDNTYNLPLPEPASASLLVLGSLLMGRRR